MRQLVELHDKLPIFDALDTDVIAVALLEEDPSRLERIERLVGPGITYLANPGERASDELPATSALLVDRQGIVRTVLPGLVQARAPTRLILEELSALTGKPVPAPEQLSDMGTGGPIEVRWAWSHDRVGPGDPLKLVFLPELGEGVALAASGESAFAVELELPPGLELVRDFELPEGEPAPAGWRVARVHRGDVPLTALELRGTDALEDGEAVVRVTVRSAFCSPRGCAEPERATYELPIRTTAEAGERGQLYAWESW